MPSFGEMANASRAVMTRAQLPVANLRGAIFSAANLEGAKLPGANLEGARTAAYALLEDAPTEYEHDLKTLAVRARAQLRPGMRAVAEVQSVTNPLLSKDVRVLVGIDLSMARGNSRFGLDRGGWLR